MFDSEIQKAETRLLEEVLKRCWPPKGVGMADLGVRVAKELRHRKKFEKSSREKHFRRLTDTH